MSLHEIVDTAEHVEPYDDCRCGRTLVCGECLNPPGECDCSDVIEDLAEDLAAAAGADHVSDLDPLTRTLLGLPSGIHCHTHGCPHEQEASA